MTFECIGKIRSGPHTGKHPADLEAEPDARRLRRTRRKTLPRDPPHGDRNACNPSVSALNGISAVPIEKLVVFVGTPGVRISA